jgi:HPt (histidine-containing phosphotransfer) domain-containing protein
MSAPIIVEIDIDLEDLVPEYLESRKTEVESLKKGLRTGDFESLRIIGHNLKGTGGGYGFDQLTIIGGEIEQAAKTTNADELERLVGELEDYLERVEVRYV